MTNEYCFFTYGRDLKFHSETNLFKKKVRYNLETKRYLKESLVFARARGHLAGRAGPPGPCGPRMLTAVVVPP